VGWGRPVTPRERSTPAPGPWAVALTGLVSLAVAMGIGRFAFTPLLPMMLADGIIELPAASLLASANYLGYLAGALWCTVQPWIWAHVPRLPAVHGAAVVRYGLVATGLLTVAMALPLPAAWPMLRFAAGVASALVFVYTSGWCLSLLAEQRASSLGGAMFAGPGAGIVLSGLCASALVQWHWHAAWGWSIFGVLALALTALVWPMLGIEVQPQSGVPAALELAPAGAPRHAGEIAMLAAAYGLAGFGYIITATFLPVIARTALPGSAWLDLFWPIFGLGVVAGALLSTRLRVGGDLRWLLAGAHLVQAAGVGAGILSPNLAGFATGSLLLGLPFTAITFFVMQEVRRLRPSMSASYMGLLTAAYGIGQIVGPAVVALMLKHSATPSAGFNRSLELAIGALLVGAVLHVVAGLAYPLREG
jgi:predicted MFS family arabinose efflux permease